MAFQGNVKQGGSNLNSGNLNVAIFDAQTGGSLVYNSTTDFDNAISFGEYDVMLGNGTNELILNYGTKYYLEMFVNGEIFTFNGNTRQVFESAVGNISYVNLESNIPTSFINKTAGTNWIGLNVESILDTIYSWIGAVNTTSNIKNLGFYTRSEVNSTIDLRENDTLGDVGACSNEQVVKYNTTSSAWYCSDVSAAETADIDAVNTDGMYLTGGQTSGTVSLLLNETKLNLSIDSFAASKEWDYNQTLPAQNYADANFVNLLGGNNINGTQNFNGGWSDGGLSIINGNLFAQTVFVYNLSSLSVTELNINSSILPQVGFDNTFDLGSSALRWRDLYLGGEIRSNGTGDNWFLGNVGIGTSSPEAKLHIAQSEASTSIHFDSFSTNSAQQPFFIFRKSSSATIGTASETVNSEDLGVIQFQGVNSNNAFVAAAEIFVEQEGAAGADFVPGMISFFTATDSAAKTERMRIDSSGNVGIGTSSPGTIASDTSIAATILNLKPSSGVASISAEGSQANLILVDKDATSGQRVFRMINSGGKVTFAGDADNAIGSSTGDAGNFMAFDLSNGNVGIGTSSPSGTLEIDSGGTPTNLTIISDTESSIFFNDKGGSAQGYKIGTSISGNTNNFEIYDTTDSRLIATFAGDGNVGIGTTTPGETLDVAGQINASTDICITGGTCLSTVGGGANITQVGSMTASIVFASGAADDHWLGLGASAGRIEFDDQSTDEVNILDANVGIGTSSPSEKLNVNGSIGIGKGRSNGFHNALAVISDTDDRIYNTTDLSLYNNATLLIENLDAPTSVFNSYAQLVLRVSGMSGASDARIVGIEPAQAQSDLAFVLRDGGFMNEKMRIKGKTGNVGIGTSSPNYLLETASGTANAVNLSNVLYINGTSGNVGIGTTSPDEKLVIYDNTNSNNAKLSLGADSTASYNIWRDDTSGLLYFNGTQSGATGYSFNNKDNAELLRITNSGNVGIGTTSPATKLHIAGASADIRFNMSGGSPIIQSGATSGTAEDIRLKSSGTGGDLYLGTETSGDVVVVKDAGNVGIGTTTPGEKLEVAGRINASTDICITGGTCLSSVGGGANITQVGSMTASLVFASGAADDHWLGLGGSAGRIEFDDQSTDEVNILDANVGIGTSSPQAILHIKSTTGNVGLKMESTATSATASTIEQHGNRSQTGSTFGGINGYWGGNLVARMLFLTGDDTTNKDEALIDFYTAPPGGGALPRMRIDKNGNVGIGTTTPNYLLQIAAGTSGRAVNLSGVMYVNSTSGNVGIGTSSPEGKLHTAGSAATIWNYFDSYSTTDGHQAIIALRKSGSATIGTKSVTADDEDLGIITGIGVSTDSNFRQAAEILISQDAAAEETIVPGRIVFNTVPSGGGLTERMRIDSSGNVGIGQTSIISDFQVGTGTTGITQAGAQLHLISTIPKIWFEDTDEGSDDKVFIVQYGNENLQFASAIDNGGSFNKENILILNRDGNVGIGTSSPSTLLEVEKDQNALTVISIDNNVAGTAAGSRLVIESDTANGNINVLSGTFTTSNQFVADAMVINAEVAASGGLILATSHATADMSFWTNSTQRITIDGASGNVGIGTSSPATTLHINSSIASLKLESGVSSRVELMFRQGGQDNWRIGQNFVVTDNTLEFYDDVNNVNRMVINQTSGNVGIGTSSPGSALEIQTPATSDHGISILAGGASGSFPFRVTHNSGTEGSYFAIQGDSGNVGIGTTSPATKLHLNDDANPLAISIDGNFTGSDGIVDQLIFFNNGDSVASMNILRDGADDAGSIRFDTQPTGSSPQTRMWIDSTGNVGIGTSSPGFPLHVKGTGGGANAPLLMLESDESQSSFINFIGDQTGTDYFLGRLDTGDADKFAIGREGITVDLVLDNSGNVGIGTESPVSKLHIEGTDPHLTLANSATEVTIDTPLGILNFYSNDGSTTSKGGVGQIRVAAETAYNSANTPSYMAFYTHDNTGNDASELGDVTEHMRISAAGNVGIGTVSPTSPLTVKTTGTGQTGGILLLASDDTNVAAFLGESGTGDGVLSLHTDNAGEKILFDAESGSNSFINNGGNVGIGTTSPTQLLEVDGNINATGTIWADGQTDLTPDYVFNYYFDGDVGEFENKDYEILTIKEVLEFTKEQKHLPGIPGVDEIGQIDLVSFQYKILEKVEEVYTYIFAHEDRIGELESENEMMKEDLCSLGVERWC